MHLVRTTYIRGTVHVRCFRAFKSTLSWFGHTQRCCSDYLGWRILRLRPPGRRSRRTKRFMEVVQHLRSVVGEGVCRVETELVADDSSQMQKMEGQQNIIRPCGLPQYQTKSTQNHKDSQLMGLIHKNWTYEYMFKFGKEFKMLPETRALKLSPNLHLTFTSYLFKQSIIITTDWRIPRHTKKCFFFQQFDQCWHVKD